MTNLEPFREFDFLPNLPKPNLDDRTFEDLVQECILRIPRYCPEWTNHNPGDPGITLIELFAWLTDHMLYRFNQVPRRYYIAFLELLGITLQAPTPAHTELTFSLTRAQGSPLRIAAGTEVATVRTETEPAIVFTTDRDLVIGQPRIQAFFVAETQADLDLSPIGENGQLNETLILFSTCQPGNCFYLVLHPSEPDSVEPIPNQLYGNTLAFTFRGATAGTTSIDPNDPPREWQAWNGEQWVSEILQADHTRGFSEFNQNNEGADVILRLPIDWKIDEFSGYRGHWIRCVYTQRRGQEPYDRSPRITSITVRSIGGTIDAREMLQMGEEFLGVSDGKPGQKFQLQEFPVLERDRSEVIQVRYPDGGIEPWEEVPDFAESSADSPHYTIDSLTGTVQFGPLVREPGSLQQNIRDRVVLEPWGKQVIPARDNPRWRMTSVLASDDRETIRSPEQQYGRVPPLGTEIWMSRYRIGGGSRGNVEAHKLIVLKTAIPYVKSVTNHQKAQGGKESESLDEAVMRVPQMLRNPDVAVTPENFEAISQQIEPRIYRAHCLPICETPGEVKLLIVPDPRSQREFSEVEFRNRFPNGVDPDQSLKLTRSLKEKLQTELDKRKPLGIKVLLAEPSYTGVKVIAEVKLESRFAIASLREEMCDRLRSKLYYFLNPITGGFDRKGWEIGRPVTPSDVIAVLQDLPEVQYVGAVKLFSLHQNSEQQWYRLSSIPELIITPRSFGLLASWVDPDSEIDSAHAIEILNA